MADRRHRFTTRARTTVKTLPAWAFSVTVLPPRVPLGVVRWPFGEGSIENPMIGWLKIERPPRDEEYARRIERFMLETAKRLGKKCLYIRSLPHNSMGFIDAQNDYNRHHHMDWHICFFAGDHFELANVQGEAFFKQDKEGEYVIIDDTDRSDPRNRLPRPLRGIEIYPYPKSNEDEDRVRQRGPPRRLKESLPFPQDNDNFDEEPEKAERDKRSEQEPNQREGSHDDCAGRGGLGDMKAERSRPFVSRTDEGRAVCDAVQREGAARTPIRRNQAPEIDEDGFKTVARGKKPK